MLLDLARNDVGRVVRYGTEQVEELMTLERYSHVMHMVSRVQDAVIAAEDGRFFQHHGRAACVGP